MSRATRKLDKMRPVASKNGEHFYAEIQGMSEKFIQSNKEVKDALSVPFEKAEDAIKHGRKIIEVLKIEVVKNNIGKEPKE